MADYTKHQDQADVYRQLRALRQERQQLKAARNRLTPLIPPRDLVGLHPYGTHPWNAQRMVSDLERRVKAAYTWLEDNNWHPLVDAVFADSVLQEGVYMPADQMFHHHVQMTVQEVSTHRLWERNRVVFEIHPGLTRHLRSSDSDKFPPMVLKNLTHPNPFVFLGEPIPLQDSAGKPLRLLGWYVAGMTYDHQYVDTTDERAHYFHITLVSEVMSADGSQVHDWDYCRVTLPITGSDATVGEIIERGLQGFNWDPALSGQTQEQQVRYISENLRVVVPHMLYLVSQNLETKPKPFATPPAPRRTKWEKKQGGGPVARQLIGFSSGPALATLERWRGEEVEPKGSRGSQGPRRASVAHVRRAHFHTFWAGTGSRAMTPEERAEKAERRVKWLAPILVNAGSDPMGTTRVTVK